MNSKIKPQTIEDWYVQNAAEGIPLRTPTFLRSHTFEETAETVTDCGYFAVLLLPEESKDGKLSAAHYREFTTYTRGSDGEPDRVMHIRTEVLFSTHGA